MKYSTVFRILNISLIGFLFSAVLIPLDHVYRSFFFVGVMPIILWAVCTRRFPAIAASRPMIAFWILLAYLVVSAFLFSDAEFSERFRHFRWILEVAALVLAISFVASHWRDHALHYGRLFLALLMLACISALVGYMFTQNYPARLSWVGFLRQPIQGPSVLIVYWATGMTLLGMAAERRPVDLVLALGSALLLLVVCILTRSRGPLLSLALYFFAAGIVFVPLLNRHRWIPIASLCVLFTGAFILLATVNGAENWLSGMIERGASYRFLIWETVVDYPPESHLFGAGVATAFVDTNAGGLLYERFNDDLSHVHNTLLNIYNTSGLVGLLCFLAALGLLFRQIFRSALEPQQKVLVLALLGLLAALHATEGYRLVSSPNPDWILIWLPLIFIVALTAQKRAGHAARQLSRSVEG